MTLSAPKSSRRKTLWFDIGDLVWWLEHHDHVTGVQRTVFSVLCCLRNESDGLFPVRFCAFNEASGFHEIDEELIERNIAIVLEEDSLREPEPELSLWFR